MTMVKRVKTFATEKAYLVIPAMGYAIRVAMGEVHGILLYHPAT